MTNELRASFEAWAKETGHDLKIANCNHDTYTSMETDWAWIGWQACHAAMQGEDVVRDAERYRLIRKGMSEYHGDVYGMTFAEDGDYPVSGDDLDKHVDAMGERHG